MFCNYKPRKILELSFVANIMTVVFSTCSHGFSVILSFIQQVFMNDVPSSVHHILQVVLQTAHKWMCVDSDMGLTLKDPVAWLERWIWGQEGLVHGIWQNAEQKGLGSGRPGFIFKGYHSLGLLTSASWLIHVQGWFLSLSTMHNACPSWKSWVRL